jgi:hypothetical protein
MLRKRSRNCRVREGKYYLAILLIIACLLILLDGQDRSMMAQETKSDGNHAKVTASSTWSSCGPEGLLSGGVVPWHAQSPPKFPEWVEAVYEKPVVATELAMQAQGCPEPTRCANRAPKSFIFQGSMDGRRWSDLLTVNNAVYTYEGQWLKWPLPGGKAYTTYRLFVKSNNGDQDYLTIQSLKITTK